MKIETIKLWEDREAAALTTFLTMPDRFSLGQKFAYFQAKKRMY